MRSFPDNSLYVLGTAKIAKNDPIADQFHTFFVGLVIDRESGLIIDMTSNMVQPLTTDFIRSIIVGYRLDEELEAIVNQIEARFFGLAQKTVIAAVKDARNRYLMVLEQLRQA